MMNTWLEVAVHLVSTGIFSAMMFSFGRFVGELKATNKFNKRRTILLKSLKKKNEKCRKLKKQVSLMQVVVEKPSDKNKIDRINEKVEDALREMEEVQCDIRMLPEYAMVFNNTMTLMNRIKKLLEEALLRERRQEEESE